MKIGIDISQIAYEGTGVAKYTRKLVENLLKIDRENEYILFFSSLRRKAPSFKFPALVKSYFFPPTLLDFLWNRLHVLPIEWLIGDIDIFITSDWTEPPTVKAKKITILHDLVVFKYPKETDQRIVDVQKRKLAWVKKEASLIICVSESTKKDAQEILGIDEGKLKVIYEGGGSVNRY